MSLPPYNPYGTTNPYGQPQQQQTSPYSTNPYGTTQGGYQPSPSYNPAHQVDNRQSISQNWVDNSAGGPMNVYKTGTGATHSYSYEERKSFAAYVNDWLANDPDLRSIIPINPDSEDLFKAVSSSCLLCKLVNVIAPGTIDERRIRINVAPKDVVFAQNENLSLAIDGCKNIGLVVANLGVGDLASGSPHMILGLMWQVIKKGLLSQVSMDLHPELSMMLTSNETVYHLQNAPPEQNLLRWVNFQLKRTAYPKDVKNFRSDIMDGQAYLALLEAIAPEFVPKAVSNILGVFQEPDPNTRCDWVCAYANQMGCGGVISPDDIKKGNEKLNLAFCAYLFNKYPGLDSYAQDHENLKREQERLRMLEEEELKRKMWEQQQQQLQQQQQAMLAMQTQQRQLEEQKRREEGELQARMFEEARLRHEAELEAARLAEEERRRQQEALLRFQEQQRLAEEERKRREEEDRRMEEERRRRAEEEELRRLREEAERQEAERRKALAEEARRRQAAEEEARRRAIAEEEARRRAWDEYNKQQANAAALQAEEERRRAAWDEYNRQEAAKQEAARLAAEEEERRRQQAWAEYNAQQEALRQQQAAQAAIARAQEAAAQAKAAQESAAQAAAAQQALLLQQQTIMFQQQEKARQEALLMTTVVPQRPITTTTVTTTRIASIFPIKRLIVRAKMAKRLIKKSALTKPDPFIKALYNGNYQRSTTLKSTCDPKFEHDFEFMNVDKIDLIRFQVYDDCQLSKDDFLGEVVVTGADCGHQGLVKDFELKSREHRVDKVHGTLTLEFKF